MNYTSDNNTYSNGYGWGESMAMNPTRLQLTKNPHIEGKYSLNSTTVLSDNISGGAHAMVVLNDVNHSKWFNNGDEVWYHWYTMIPKNGAITYIRGTY